MASFPERFRHDERGMAVVFVAVGLVTLVSATTLAIDVGMLMTARTQAQNAADAGALAGAVALTLDDFNDRTINGPVVQSAVAAAKAAGNGVMGAPVAIDPADVTFPVGPTGVANRVQIRVSRSAARGNPLSTLIAGIFGADTADVSALATAEATPANAATCVAPFAIPDRWMEGTAGGWDPNDTFNNFAATGKDNYYTATQANYPGYNAQRDKGVQLRLTVTNGGGTVFTLGARQYFRLSLPGSDGFAEDIQDCNSSMMHFGDTMTHQPADMSQESAEGLNALIDQDPSAYWDTVNNRVVSSMNPSPRVKVVPVYDPLQWQIGKRNFGRNADLKAANYIGFFIERVELNGDIVGRITPVSGVADRAAAAAPSGSFARAIRLVQ